MWHPLRHTYAWMLAAGGIRRHAAEQLIGHEAQGATGALWLRRRPDRDAAGLTASA